MIVHISKQAMRNVCTESSHGDSWSKTAGPACGLLGNARYARGV